MQITIYITLFQGLGVLSFEASRFHEVTENLQMGYEISCYVRISIVEKKGKNLHDLVSTVKDNEWLAGICVHTCHPWLVFFAVVPISSCASSFSSFFLTDVLAPSIFFSLLVYTSLVLVVTGVEAYKMPPVGGVLTVVLVSSCTSFFSTCFGTDGFVPSIIWGWFCTALAPSTVTGVEACGMSPVGGVDGGPSAVAGDWLPLSNQKSAL